MKEGKGERRAEGGGRIGGGRRGGEGGEGGGESREVRGCRRGEREGGKG